MSYIHTKIKIGLLKEKLERISGRKIILKEADVSGIMDRLDDKAKTSTSPYVQQDLQSLRKFVDFNPETDTLIKSEYERIKEALNKWVRFNLGKNTMEKTEEIANREGLPFKNFSMFAKENGTTPPKETWRTILDMLYWGDKIPASYIKLMNPIEKEVYDYQNSSKPDTELYNAVKEKLALVKTRIVKREPKSVSVARHREEIKGALNPHLREVIDNIAEEFRKVVEEDNYNYYMKLIEIFKKDFGSNEATTEQYRAKYYKADPKRPDKDWAGKWSDQELKYSHLFNYSPTEIKIKSDAETIARKQAIENSEAIKKNFQAKMYDKLSGFLTELGKEFDITYKGKMRVNDIYFKFTDGSRFSIRNQIVSHFRWPGGFYYSYPTTFHDAYLPNGVKINQPSEYTIKKAFLDYQNQNK